MIYTKQSTIMQKSIFIFAAAFLFSISLKAQFEYGLRMGVSSQNLKANDLFIASSNFNDVQIGLANASYGYHFGLFTQVKAFGFTISPEILFNSNEYEYRVQEIRDGQVINKVLKDRYQFIDIPILFGVKLGFLRAYAGPEVHYFVNSYSNLLNIEGINEAFERVNYGAILGAGMNLGRLRLDVRYEYNFDNFEDHIFFDNNPLNFNTDDTRMIFSVGWKF